MDVVEKKMFQVNANRRIVWSLLCDPWKIAPCLPGAELVESLGENKYRGKIKVKIGPVTTNFDGQVEFTELDDVNYHFRVKGRGSDKQGKGGATMEMAMDLQESEQGQTRVDCSMRVSITGRIAQFGARMIHAVNNKMFDRFTANFHLLLEKQAAGEEFAANEDKVVNAGAMVGSIIKDSVTGIFKKKE